MAYKLLTSILFFTLLNNANLRILSKDGKTSVEVDMKSNLPTSDIKNATVTVESKENKVEIPKPTNLDKAKFEHLPMLGNNVSQEKNEKVIQIDSNPELSKKENEMLKVVEQNLIQRVDEHLDEKISEENKVLTNNITDKLEEEFKENKNAIGKELIDHIAEDLDNQVKQELKKLTNDENTKEEEQRKDVNTVKVVSVMIALVAFCFTLF